MWTNDQAAHRPHNLLVAEPYLKARLQSSMMASSSPLQTAITANTVKCSVYKKSMYSHPAEMKIYFLGQAISYTPEERRKLGQSFCVMPRTQTFSVQMASMASKLEK